MENHTNNVALIRTESGAWVTGDPFWPKTTEDINKAARLVTNSDARKYIKVAEKRLKMGKLSIVNGLAEYDADWTLVKVTLR